MTPVLSTFKQIPLVYKIFLLMLISALNSNAQTMIMGKVTDEHNNLLSYATLILLQPSDSTMIKTALTDQDGLYSITYSINEENIIVRAEMMGYTSQYKLTPVSPTPEKADFFLQPSTNELEDVVVTGKKPLIERQIDRVVFHVENSISSIGGDGLEALKRPPGIRVNNNTISMIGKSTVNVMINDRLVQLSGDELAQMLRTIPADEISKIEIITAPPAKYDASGNSGILNIVTKKSKSEGLNGSITAGTGRNRATPYFANGNFNYRDKKLNVYGSGNPAIGTY